MASSAGKGVVLVAHLEVTGMDDIMKMFEKLEAPEKIAKEAIGKAEKALLKSTKSAVKSALVNQSATGLVSSFVPTGAKENQWGVYSVVRPVGSDENGITYAQKALWLEYGRFKTGNKGRNGSEAENRLQVGRPWRQAAINSAQAECEKIIEDVINKAVEG